MTLDGIAEAGSASIEGAMAYAARYAVQTAIQRCIDLANHVVASERLGVPSSNADVFIRLADHGLLDRALAERLASAAGFRNILVHQYDDVSDDLVLKNITDGRADLRAFAAVIATLADR